MIAKTSMKIDKIILIIICIFCIEIYIAIKSYPQDEPNIIEIKKEQQEEVKNYIIGIASWYNYSLNGIEWSKTHRTCASRTLKRYSTAKITNLDNGKSVECYVNDFGPEEWTGRDIDLSSFAFNQIADLKIGLIKVKIE